MNTKTNAKAQQVQNAMLHLYAIGERKLAWKFYRVVFKSTLLDVLHVKLAQADRKVAKQAMKLDAELQVAEFKHALNKL